MNDEPPYRPGHNRGPRIERPRIVTDEEVADAKHWLMHHTHERGAARGEVVRADAMLKHVHALVMKQYANLPVSAQEREARAHPSYLNAIEKAVQAAIAEATLKAQTEACQATIQIWTTETAARSRGAL